MMNIVRPFSRNRLVLALFLSMSLLLTGCSEGTGDDKGNFLGLSLGSPSKEIVVKGAPLGAEEIPWHIQSTVAATVLRLKGGDPDEIDTKFNIVGSGGIGEDETTDIKNFGVQNVQINDFFRPAEAPELYRLGARLIMVGPAGRRLGLSFVADYELSKDQVVLKGFDWDYIRAAAPGAETYIIPTEALAALDEKTAKDYTDFRSHILTNAVSTGDNATSVQNEDYSIVTFVMDRLLVDDKFELRISDVEDGNEGYTEDSRYIVHDGGWVTAVIPGKFSLSDEKAFWIKAVYMPKTEKKGFLGFLTNEELIGLFSTANLSSTTE